MAVTADRVVVEFEARLGKYEADVARAEQKFDRAMGSIQKNAGRTEALVSRAAGSMSAALAGVSTGLLIRGFLSLADQAKTLDAQLKLATRTFGSFAQAQEDVRRVSAEARAGLAETASLYGSFVRTSQELGRSQGEAAQATETFTKALKLGGAGTAQVQSATLQMGQALASANVQWEELGQILEASPRLAKVFTDSLGVTRQELKQMAEQGKLTGEQLYNALNDRKVTEGIDAEFKQLPVTFDDAMTQVYNSAVITFGAFDRGGEFSTILANFVTDGSGGFAALEQAAESFGIRVRSELEGAASIARAFFAELKNIGDQLGINKALEAAGGARNVFGTAAGIAFDPLGTAFRSTPRYREAAGAAMQRGNQQAAIRANQNSFWGRFLEQAQKPYVPPVPRSAPKPAGRKASARTPRSPLDADAFAREEAALNDDILRLKGEEAQNIEERTLTEMKRLEAGKAAAVAEIEGDKRFTAAQKERLVALVGTANALAQAKVLAERDVEVAKQALDAKLATIGNERDLLRAQADLTEGRKARTDIELRILDLAYEQERAELDAVIASKDATDAQKKIAEARLAILGQLESADRAGVARRNESPLARYGRDLAKSDRANDEVEQAVIQELEGVRDSISSAAQKALGVKNPILAALINSFIEQQLIAPFIQAMSGMGGGGGLIGGAIGVVGGLLGFASGGSFQIGGRGGADRNTLSLNGRPIANVSRGETLHVSNQALRGRGGGATVVQHITVDARNSVNPEGFARQILAISGQQAQHAAASVGQTVIKAMPMRMSQFQRDGT